MHKAGSPEGIRQVYNALPLLRRGNIVRRESPSYLAVAHLRKLPALFEAFRVSFTGTQIGSNNHFHHHFPLLPIPKVRIEVGKRCLAALKFLFLKSCNQLCLNLPLLLTGLPGGFSLDSFAVSLFGNI